MVRRNDRVVEQWNSTCRAGLAVVAVASVNAGHDGYRRRRLGRRLSRPQTLRHAATARPTPVHVHLVILCSCIINVRQITSSYRTVRGQGCRDYFIHRQNNWRKMSHIGWNQANVRCSTNLTATWHIFDNFWFDIVLMLNKLHSSVWRQKKMSSCLVEGRWTRNECSVSSALSSMHSGNATQTSTSTSSSV